jgi:uncharacterized membrane protein YciS (DUF1049 family)
MISVLEILASAILWSLGLLITIMGSVLYSYFSIKIYRYFAKERKIKRENKKNNNKE